MRRPLPLPVVVPLVTALLVTAGCGGDSSTTTTAKPSPTTVRPQASAKMSPTLVLNADLQYSTFAAVWDASGRAKQLNGLKELTVFAPTDAAMDTLGAEARDRLTTDEEAASAFVDRYTVEEKLGVNDLLNLQAPATTVDGTALTVTLPGAGEDGSDGGGPVRVNGAPISTSDIQTRNGYVQVIGALFPSS